MNTKNNPKSFFEEIPKGWKCDRLKDVVTLRDCRTDERSEVEDYLELEDIESGTGRILSRRNTLEVESNVTCFKKGDVLFGKLRPYLEKYYFAEFDGKCTGEILAFAPEGIEGHFLRYCVAAPWFVAECNALAYGAKMPRVNWPKQLAIFDIPLPPRDEQRRIAAYLDKACAVIDGAIRAKRQQLEVLDDLRKSIIHNAVTYGLDEKVDLVDSGVEWLTQVPQSWRCLRIKDIATLSPGFSGSVPTPSELCVVVPMEALSDKGDIETSLVQEFQDIQKGLTTFEKGDVLFAKITPCMENGKGALVGNLPTRYGFGSTEFHVLRPGRRVDGKFLYYFTFNSVYRNYAAENMSGAAGQKRVSTRFLSYTTIFLPSIVEQRKIVAYIDERCRDLDDLHLTLEKQISALEQYRKSLIHECVTGKRRINKEESPSPPFEKGGREVFLRIPY